MKKYINENVYRKMNKKKIFLLSGIIMTILIGAIMGIKLTHHETQAKEQSKRDIKMTELPQVKEEKVFSSLLPEGEKQNESYLDDAVFIGDSRVEGFIQSLQLVDTTSYTHKGLNVNAVFRDQFININGKLYNKF